MARVRANRKLALGLLVMAGVALALAVRREVVFRTSPGERRERRQGTVGQGPVGQGPVWQHPAWIDLIHPRGRGLVDGALWAYALLMTAGASYLTTFRPSRRSTGPSPPSWMDGTPGQYFGRYQLLSRLGEGGMAEVFTAVSHGVAGFSRVFVLKRLRRELCHDTDAIGQFIDEARMQANLVHGNIVPAFDLGRVGDDYFMTQEYIVGRDLTRLTASSYELRQQALSPRLAYYVVLETLQALQYAHTRSDKEGRPLGIVHRDVSAGNIIVSAQGEVKLADFGIVQSNRKGNTTRAGTIKGNANFMSPEQARGEHVDSRSDLFSAGLVLYFCLMNRVPYGGGNELDVLFKAASGPTAEFIQSVRHLPSPAQEVLGRALALDPAERFQTASEFADVLAPHVGGAKLEAARLMQSLFGDALKLEAA